MYLSTFLKNEYLTSTCTWYIFGVLGVLEYLVNCLNKESCSCKYKNIIIEFEIMFHLCVVFQNSKSL